MQHPISVGIFFPWAEEYNETVIKWLQGFAAQYKGNPVKLRRHLALAIAIIQTLDADEGRELVADPNAPRPESAEGWRAHMEG